MRTCGDILYTKIPRTGGLIAAHAGEKYILDYNSVFTKIS